MLPRRPEGKPGLAMGSSGLETEGRRRRGRRAARLRRVRPRASSPLLRARQTTPSFGLALKLVVTGIFFMDFFYFLRTVET